jgi:pentose-5-phosphate-3-epimerase
MHLLPSLLEYSPAQLKKKLSLLQAKYGKFLTISGQPKQVLDLHLDFVLPQFAKDRSVMASLGLATVLEELGERFLDNKLILSLHLMGSLEDMLEANQFFTEYTFNPAWTYTIFVDESIIPTFRIHELLFANVALGIWHDPAEWSTETNKIPSQSIQNYLLMTVVAGKSGQAKTIELENAALTMAQTSPQIEFIVDGGWSLEDLQRIGQTQDLKNLKIVSYSSFWQELES